MQTLTWRLICASRTRFRTSHRASIHCARNAWFGCLFCMQRGGVCAFVHERSFSLDGKLRPSLSCLCLSVSVCLSFSVCRSRLLFTSLSFPPEHILFQVRLCIITAFQSRIALSRMMEQQEVPQLLSNCLSFFFVFQLSGSTESQTF